MKTNRLHTFCTVLCVLLTVQACGPRNKTDQVTQSTADTDSIPVQNNGGIPLDNIERKTDADTLQLESKNSTGVPMSNIDRNEKNDTTGQPQSSPE